jgi:hypothetical protein
MDFVDAGPFPQELDGVTVMLPDVAPAVTVILAVPWPVTIAQPAGTVQVYVTNGVLITL